MRTKVTLLALAFGGLVAKAQTVADFETHTLTANSAFSPSTTTVFQTINATFPYEWDNAFTYWAGGFAYTNKQDSTNGTFTNLYGVKAFKGYNQSSNYVVAQNKGTIKLVAPFDRVDGFYLTNTTFAYKVIKNGNTFSRKFGDTTGTKTGTTYPQGGYPDYFKVTVKGFKNGAMKQDSVVFFLADYRFSNSAQDYVVDDWRWVNTSSLGSVDSIRFFMYSSDVGAFGINTPLFFALDDFTTSAPNLVGINYLVNDEKYQVYPNPFNTNIIIFVPESENETDVIISELAGKVVGKYLLKKGNTSLPTTQLEKGIYLLEFIEGDKRTVKRMIKE